MKVDTKPIDVEALLQRLDAQDAEIQRLRALVEPDHKGEQRVRSRRDMLKLAGAAVVGAAGAAAMRVVPAAAANGDPITVGGTFTGTSPTSLTNTSGDALSLTGTTGFAAGVRATGYYGVVGTGQVGVAGTTGAGNGVYAASLSGNGVYASGGSGVGGTFVGGRAAVSLLSAGGVGPPVSNAHSVGDVQMDNAGTLWVCVTSGTPGVFVPLQPGAANITHFVKVSNKQYNLPNSDGVTWVDMDATNLMQSITPLFNAQAVISVSTDLWTANSGFNQDIGIFISGGAYGTGTIVAWKESGGSAGTYSPNAAFVETTQPFVAGTAYTIKVRWKTNQPAGGATIFAGAGPLSPSSAGGGVAGQVSPTRLATHLVVDVPSPLTLHIPANDPTKTPPAPALPARP